MLMPSAMPIFGSLRLESAISALSRAPVHWTVTWQRFPVCSTALAINSAAHNSMSLSDSSESGTGQDRAARTSDSRADRTEAVVGCTSQVSRLGSTVQSSVFISPPRLRS